MLAINGRFYLQPLEGVQRFARGVVEELAQIRSDVVILMPANATVEQLPEGVDVREFGRLRSHAWEQVDLVRELKRMGNPLLLSLTNSGPLTYKNQIVTHHDVTYASYPGNYRRSMLRWYRFLTPRLLRSARHTITVSEFSKQEISRHYGLPLNKIAVIYNAPDEEFVANGSQNFSVSDMSDPFALAVTSLGENKNFPGLVRGFLAASEKTEDLILKVVGVAPERALGKHPELEIPSDKIRLLGRVSEEELRGLYRDAEFFVSSSLYEGFCIPLVEAQASRTPVAAAAIPTALEVLADSAHFFEPGSDLAISEAFQRMHNDPSLRSALRASGCANMERFTWKRSAETLNELLATLE